MFKKIFHITVYILAAIGLFFILAYIAIQFGLTKTSGTNRKLEVKSEQEASGTLWQTSEEWQTLKLAITQEKDAITLAAQKAGVSPRLVVAQLVVEQLRLFTTNRELFKEVFKPLNMLGVQSQYSWGVMGLKQETAIEIEKHLKDVSSDFYLGKNYENILNYSAEITDKDTARFERLTHEKDHAWSYLYAAVHLKQLTTQWQKAGFDISGKPGVVSTLFNIGFQNSKPHADSQVGGAEIEFNGQVFSFGSLAEAFYNSEELRDIFPN